MPQYEINVPGAGRFRVSSPTDLTDQQVWEAVKGQISTPAEPQKAGFSLGDLAASFSQGALGSTQALTDVFGAGNVASSKLEELAKASQAGMSPARQAELLRQQERLKKAEQTGSTWEEIKAAAQNIAEAPLQSAAQAVGSFVPYLPAMFAGPAAAALGLGARATAAASAVSRVAPEVIGTAQGAGSVKSAIYDAVYDAEIKDGTPEQEARAKATAAQEYAGKNIDQIATGAGLGFVSGRFGAEKLLSPQSAAKASQSMAGRIATAAAADVPTEALQGGQERLASNIALQREGVDVPTFQGVAGQAAQEGLLGLLGSAPVAAVRGPDVEALRAEEQRKQMQEFEAEKAKALAEAAARPAEPEEPIRLPGGFRIERQEVSRETIPESYGIFAEGQEAPLTTVASPEEAQRKLESFKQIREGERETFLSEIDKINSDVQKTRDRIDYLEATGQTASDEYQKLKTSLPEQELAAETKARDLAEQMEQLGKPMTIAPIGEREQVNEQFNLITPTNKIEGTFATPGEAEASLRQLLGDEVFKEEELKAAAERDRKARDQQIVALEQQLLPKLKQFGLGDVGLKVVEQIENGAGGAYLNRLIKVAMDEANPMQTMRHESLHALKDLGFFTPQQWKALEERAKKDWIEQLKKTPHSEGVSRHDAYIEMFKKEAAQKGLTDKAADQYVNDSLIEEAIADAFGAYDKGATPPPGMIAALFKKLKNFFVNFGQALRGAGFESADDIFQRVERGELKGRKPVKPAKAAEPAAEAKPSKESKAAKKVVGEKPEVAKPSEWKADNKEIKQADEYFDENGVMPYTSEGQLDVPLDVSGTKYSIKKPYDQKAMAKDQTLKNDPLTGLPLNANGTVTLYFPTDNAGARDLAKTKRLKGATPEANRVYLTNESSAAAVQANPGMIDQPLGGANVLLQVDPSLLHVLEEYEDGRKDFFIPIAEGEYFAKKMAQTKLFTLNAPRTKGLHPDRTLSQVTKTVNDTADAWAKASKQERAEMARNAKAVLRDQHNIEKLFGANSKLEKTNIGDYGLTYKGKKVMSTGLGFASAQKINDEQRATTCPQSAICEALCLGETSGQNRLYGGDGPFRSGPRLSQFLKTEALVVNPEAFTVALIKQIETFRNAAKRLGYQPAIRLNVTSDFNPKTFENVIKMFPDVMFYDYTKLDTKPIAPNHHLTYSSTGASQVVNGEVVLNRESNWDRMVDKVLSNGKNVALAFTSRTAMPKAVVDERTGKTFEVWNGDEYDARFLDPVREDGTGWIIGLTNKDNTTKPEEAAKKHNGFFLDYDAARDGDTLIIRNQTNLKDQAEGKPAGKVIPIAKFSLKGVGFPSVKAVKEAVAETDIPDTKAFKEFIGASRWLDEDKKPIVFYHATAREFFEFTPAGQSKAIFLATTPEEAETFGSIAEDRLRREIYKALNKDDKLEFFQNIVDAEVKKGTITEKEGADFMRQAKRKIPEYGDFGDIEAQTYDALIALSPTRMSIMPLYARAETPFDFENPEHVEQVMQWVANNTQIPQDFPDKWLAGMKGRISQGLWQAIEDKRVQQAIRALGFDAFTVRENRNSPKNYAVYEPTQVKSVTGNIGNYSLESKDIRYSLKKVAYTPERFDKLWSVSMYTQSGEEKTTKGYMSYVNPMEFVEATSNPDMLKRLRNEQEPLDFDKMKSLGPMALDVSVGKNGEWNIDGHEGRHRMLALADAGYRSVPVFVQFKSPVKDAESFEYKSIPAQYPDAIASRLFLSDVEPLSFSNKDKAQSKFTRFQEKPTKYNLPKMPTALEDRVGETTTRREPERLKERMTEAISPKGRSYFRQKALNRYNQLSVYDKKLVEKMGGAELLADQSAESAALMSDLGAGVAASAMGFGDRHGGVPVYKNGVTTIDRSVKGLIAALGPLAKYNDPKIYQYYQYWAMVKRGVRLNAEGRETGIDATDVQYAKYLQDKFPEFVQVQKDFIAFNNGLVKYARSTGVISEQNAEAFMKYADYVPFYRQMDGETTVGPNIFQSIAGVKAPKKLKGGNAPLADFLETAVRNTQSMIQAGMKNAAAQRAVNVVTKVKAPGMGAERLDFDANGPDVFHVLENGKRVSYRTPDHLLLDAISSLHMTELPFMGILSAPANALRNLVTKDPGFMMANLMRDSLSAWVTSGQKMTPVAGTVINFGKALAGKSKGYEALLDAGVIGGYELSQNIERSGRQLEEDLAKKAGKKAPLPLRPFTWLWEGLEKGTEASDAATRALVYERVMKETGNEAEALFRALEVMNFNRKGNSPLIRVLTAAVPFLNARMQGLDLFYRASTGNMNMADKKAIQRKFWARGASMMAISCYYWLLVHDDDDYKAQEQETKDNNWIVPSLGIRIPIPFEVGVLFKTIPERIMAYSFGNDTGKDFAESMKRSAINTFAFNPIPQTVKPIVEATTNFNFFTWREIVGQGMKDVEPEYQVGPGTSKIAKFIGENIGLSPLKIDHMIKGYTGTMGMYAIDTVDYLLDQYSDSPKAAKRFEQMPVIKRFAVDPAARGTVTAYYELKDSVDTTVRTMNLLERSMEPEKFAEYVQKNAGVLAVKDYVRDLEKTMKEFREMRQSIQVSGMSAEDKRDALLAITQSENNLTKNIQEVKKAIASIQ